MADDSKDFAQPYPFPLILLKNGVWRDIYEGRVLEGERGGGEEQG